MPYLHSDSQNLYAQFYEVRRMLAEVTAAYWTDLEIYSYLNRAQQDIAVKSRCLQKKVTVTTVASQQEYDLKDNSFADIIDVAEDGVYFYTNGSAYTPLKRKHKWQLDKEFFGWQGVAASIPQYYYYDKPSQTMGLFPKPNASNAGAYLNINGYYKPKVLHAGTAAAGAATTLTLAAGSSTAPYGSAVNDYYNGIWMEIYSGTGVGEKAEITDYVASTKLCTVNFTTTPSTDSIYGMIPEINSEAHKLMILYALGNAWTKGGIRTQLGNNFMQQYYQGLSLFIDNFSEDADDIIIKDTYA